MISVKHNNNRQSSNKLTCPFNSVFMQRNVYPPRVKIYIRLNARPWVDKMVFAIQTSNGNRFRVAFFCKSSNRQFNVHTIPPPHSLQTKVAIQFTVCKRSCIKKNINQATGVYILASQKISSPPL